MCGCNNKVKKSSCSCSPVKKRSIGCNCFQGCESPEEKNPFCCNEKPKKSLCFEEVCEEETFDARQIRYKSGCVDDEESPLINLNIGLGDNLEHIINTFGNRLMDLDYFEDPTLEEYPELDTVEKQFLYLFSKIKMLEQKIEQLECKN